MESAWTVATTAASSVTSFANAHQATKEEATVVGGAGEVEEAVEEEVALRVPTSKTTKTLPAAAEEDALRILIAIS